jgi:hypothetical protein
MIGLPFDIGYLHRIIGFINKKRMKFWGCILLLLVLISGCGLGSYRKSKTEQITGGIYVINLNVPEHPGFHAVFIEKSGSERQLLREGDQIDYLTGDDSVIMIKTKGTRYPTYYEIFHRKGDSILAISRLSETDFEAKKNGFKEKYHFVDSGE